MCHLEQSAAIKPKIVGVQKRAVEKSLLAPAVCGLLAEHNMQGSDHLPPAQQRAGLNVPQENSLMLQRR
jgi:hypothetical protein